MTCKVIGLGGSTKNIVLFMPLMKTKSPFRSVDFTIKSNLDLVSDRIVEIIQGYNDLKTGSVHAMPTHSRPHTLPAEQRENSLVKDMTVEQLRTLIQITVEELLIEFLGDPDEGLELRADLQEQLLQQQKQMNGQRGLSTTEVFQVLELD